MIETIGFWGSAAAGFVLLFMCALGLRGFLGRAINTHDLASRMLARAIICGFTVAGLNTLYWQVGGQVLIAFGIATVADVRLIGSYLDILFKGGGALAVYLHLAAWRLSLPEPERRKWSVFAMAFYPRGDGFLARALNGFCRRE